MIFFFFFKLDYHLHLLYSVCIQVSVLSPYIFKLLQDSSCLPGIEDQICDRKIKVTNI